MKMLIAVSSLALLVAACGETPAAPAGDTAAASPAQTGQVVSDNPELCALGLKVLTPGGNPGTVVKVEGSGCTIKDDASGLESVWTESVLEPAPGTTPAMEMVPGAPKPGIYQCRGGPAGNFKIEFRNGNAYANDKGDAGAYAFDPQNADIDFSTGPWAGFYARVLKDGDVGISGKPDRSFFQMTCQLLP